MIKKEKNPRSKLGNMKFKYFMTCMGIYAGMFLLLYLFATVVFTIIESNVYVNFWVVVLLNVLCIVLTNYIVNEKMEKVFLREEVEVKPNELEIGKKRREEIRKF